MYVHDSDEYISNCIRKHGGWEFIATEVLRELIQAERKEGKVLFVDVGANIGYFSLIAAALEVPVVAFEPVTKNHSVFQKSIELNGFQDRIRLEQLAVSDKEGTILLNLSDSNMGLCSSRDLTTSTTGHETCTTVPLDMYFADEHEFRMIVKIDVEWMELQVLRGMRRLLQERVRYVLIEISSYVEEIFDIFRAAGFTVVVNVGFDPEDHTALVADSKHLQEAAYYTKIDACEQHMKEASGNTQRMFLFMRPEMLFSLFNYS